EHDTPTMRAETARINQARRRQWLVKPVIELLGYRPPENDPLSDHLLRMEESGAYEDHAKRRLPPGYKEEDRARLIQEEAGRLRKHDLALQVEVLDDIYRPREHQDPASPSYDAPTYVIDGTPATRALIEQAEADRILIRAFNANEADIVL